LTKKAKPALAPAAPRGAAGPGIFEVIELQPVFMRVLCNLQKPPTFYRQRIEEPNGKSITSWVFQSVGKILGLRHRVARRALLLCKELTSQ
jgi:hypothetical protein